MPADRPHDNNWVSGSIVLIAILLSVAALYLGRELLIPVAFAVLLTVLLRPIVRRLEKARVPAAGGAAIVVLAILTLFIGVGWALSWPVEDWVANAPKRIEAAQAKLETIRRPVQKATEVATKFTHGNDQAPATSQTAVPAPTPAPQVPSVLARVFGTTTTLLGGLIEVLLLTYLLLASGDLFARKLIKVIPRWRDKNNAVQTIAEVESAVLRYLAVAALIYAGQGAVVAIVMWFLKVPNPLLWGIFTVMLEFIPYIGATIMIAMLSIVAFATFDEIGRILTVPASYLVIATLQANIVSPIIYGQRLKLNPVAVLVSVLFWWSLWGIAGAFLAVPIIATIKIIADRAEGMRAVGEFLGE